MSLLRGVAARHSRLSIVPADPAPARPPEASRFSAVVVPSYRVSSRILDVLRRIGPEVGRIYVVDDACPEKSGDVVERECRDPRVVVIRHAENRGVGAAVITGMQRALADGAEVIVKLDGDGQMDPEFLPIMIEVIVSGQADYVKGNRFFDPEVAAAMPLGRLMGNATLSFLAKLSTGYWHSFDPTNGYVAIHAEVARRLPLHKLSERYFFETDLLFRLSTLKARVVDIPMPAIYGDERSGLNAAWEIGPFAIGHLRNFVKRIAYNYFVRDFSIASLELLAGLGLLAFGIVYGISHWSTEDRAATAGTVMLAGLPVILGVQLLLAFLAHDVQSAPITALHPRLTARTMRLSGEQEDVTRAS